MRDAIAQSEDGDAIPPGHHFLSIGERFASSIPQGLQLELGEGLPTTDLLPSEMEATEGWTLQRRTQFGLGRECARRALERLGYGAGEIPFDEEGAPVWPRGTVGSISHKRQSCVAVVGRASEFGGVGIDLELDNHETVEQELVERVCCTDGERQQIVALRAEFRSPATAFLAAKEAFFKLQFPKTRRQLDWCDVEVRFGPNTFEVGLVSLQETAEGRYLSDAGWLLTAVWEKHK